MPLADMWRAFFPTRPHLARGPQLRVPQASVAKGGGTEKGIGIVAMPGAVFGRAIPAYLSGTARVSPFLNPSGTKVAVPRPSNWPVA